MSDAPTPSDGQTLLERHGFSAWHLAVPVLALLLDAGILLSGAGSQTTWYVIRASGVIAYVLLAASVIAGLLMTNRTLPAGRSRVDLFEVHNFSSLLILAFASVHGAALLLDSFIGFSATQVVVPFTSAYRPLAVAAGILCFYVAALVYASFYARRFLGYRAWRTLHFASFAAFLLGSAHGIFSGSDSGTWWMTALYAGSIVSVLALTTRRILGARRAGAAVLSAA